MYTRQIDNYSAHELKGIFEMHISPIAGIQNDNWKGYKPFQKEYNIEQIESNAGLAFEKLHSMIHLVKSWIRKEQHTQL